MSSRTSTATEGGPFLKKEKRKVGTVCGRYSGTCLEDHKFKVSLSYRVRSWPPWFTYQEAVPREREKFWKAIPSTSNCGLKWPAKLWFSTISRIFPKHFAVGKELGKAWSQHQGSPELWTWANPNSPEAKLDPGVSSPDTWATCSDLFTTSPAAAAHNSWFTDFFFPTTKTFRLHFYGRCFLLLIQALSTTSITK